MKWHWLPLTSVEGLRKLPPITPVHHQVLDTGFPGLTLLLSGELPPTPPPVPRPGVSGAPAPSAGGFLVHSESSPQCSFPGEGGAPRSGEAPNIPWLYTCSAQLPPPPQSTWVSCSHCRRQGAANPGSETQYACAKPTQLQHSAPQKQQDRAGEELMVTAPAEDWNLVPDTNVK